MKTFLKVSLIAIVLGFFASPAFAIDQVRLNNGQIVEGTVLNDMTNLYVDIRLVNGDSKRIPHSEIASVDRDVPSRKDRDVQGNQSLGWVSANLGGLYVTDNIPNNEVLFDYGVKAGVVTGQMGDTKFGFAVSYDHAHRGYGDGNTFSATASYNDINLQLLFLRVGNSGFYFGPDVGLSILSTSNYSYNGFVTNQNTSASNTNFEAGAVLGYDVYLSDSFSVGPEIRYEHVFGSTALNVMKFNLDFAIHF